MNRHGLSNRKTNVYNQYYEQPMRSRSLQSRKNYNPYQQKFALSNYDLNERYYDRTRSYTESSAELNEQYYDRKRSLTDSSTELNGQYYDRSRSFTDSSTDLNGRYYDRKRSFTDSSYHNYSYQSGSHAYASSYSSTNQFNYHYYDSKSMFADSSWDGRSASSNSYYEENMYVGHERQLARNATGARSNSYHDKENRHMEHEQQLARYTTGARRNSYHDKENRHMGLEWHVAQNTAGERNISHYDKENMYMGNDQHVAENSQFTNNLQRPFGQVNDFSRYEASRTQYLHCRDAHIDVVMFYERVLYDLIREHGIDEDVIRQAIQELVQNYQKLSNGKPVKSDFNRLELCLGYMHRYAACHSIMVQEYCTGFLQTVEHPTLTSTRLNVVSLGGGSGNDLLGFLHTLSSIQATLPRLKLTVIDQMSGWETVFKKVLHFWRCQESADDEYLKVSSCFVQADLCAPDNSKFNAAVSKADILLMVKCLSSVPEENKSSVLQNILDSMSLGSILIFIDWPVPHFFTKAALLKEIYSYNTGREFQILCQNYGFGYNSITTSSAVMKVYQRI